MSATKILSDTTVTRELPDVPGRGPARRHILDHYEVQAERLQFFNAVLRQISEAAPSFDVDQIVTAGRRVIDRCSLGQSPVFIETRLQAFSRLEAMDADAGWGLPKDDCARIARLRSYVNEPDDLLPDALPVIGRLDDALLIDVGLREMHEALADYECYCRYCQVAADFACVDVAEVSLTRADWLQALGVAHEQPASTGTPRSYLPANRYTPDLPIDLFHIH